MFKVDKDSSKFPPKDEELFCCHVTRLLFGSKRARPDILYEITPLLSCGCFYFTSAPTKTRVVLFTTSVLRQASQVK